MTKVLGSVLLVFGVIAFFSSLGMIEWSLLNEQAFVFNAIPILLFSFAVFYLFR